MRPGARHLLRPSRAAALLVPLLLVVSVDSGCAARGRSRTDPGVAPNAPGLHGRATSRFVFDPKNPALTLPADTELRPPEPRSDNRTPEYPSAALAAGAGGFAGFRFVVGTDGAVGTLGRSPLVPEMEGAFAEEFRASAVAAVVTWRFEPAVLLRTEDGNDLDGDGKPDYRRATSMELVPVYLDIRFDFEIVHGRGSVRASGAAAP